jgi:hypothetical protein
VTEDWDELDRNLADIRFQLLSILPEGWKWSPPVKRPDGRFLVAASTTGTPPDGLPSSLSVIDTDPILAYRSLIERLRAMFAWKRN